MFGKLRGDESGFTLPELLTYTLLLGLVLSVVAGIVVSSTVTERTVSGIVASSTNAQVAVDSIATGIRNSSAFKVDDVGGDQILRARVARGEDALSWVCSAWYYSSSRHELRYRVSSTAIATPSSTQVTDWLLLADHVSPPSGQDVFTVASGEVALAFLAESADQTPTEIATSAARRIQDWESAPCF